MEQVYIPQWIAFGVGTKSRRDSVVDTDLQIREGSHPDPEIRERSQKTFFSALRASVWSKNKGAAPRSPPPWIPLRLKNSFKEDPTSKFCAPYYVFVPPHFPLRTAPLHRLSRPVSVNAFRWGNQDEMSGKLARISALLVSFSETNKGRTESQSLLVTVSVHFIEVCVKRHCTVMWPKD